MSLVVDAPLSIAGAGEEFGAAGDDGHSQGFGRDGEGTLLPMAMYQGHDPPLSLHLRPQRPTSQLTSSPIQSQALS